MQSIATTGNHSLASSHTHRLRLSASQTAAHARTRRCVYIHKTLRQSHISQTQPFRLSVKASGCIINYIWHCFLCVYVCGSAICPKRLEQGKWGSKTPCQNAKSILIHAHTHTHARLHRDTHTSNKEMSVQWLEGIVSLSLWCYLSSPSPSLLFLHSCLSLSLSLLLHSSLFLSLWIQRVEPRSRFCLKLAQAVASSLCSYRLFCWQPQSEKLEYQTFFVW